MNAQLKDEQMDKWFSTYGAITAERILSRYHIILPQNELLNTIRSPFSFYHQLLKIPLKNVLNGIVLQQASDYHVYGQKLFIDYLLSGESGKPADSPGATTRESLENERQMLVTLGEDFNGLQTTHSALISKSQASLIKLADEWNKAFEAALKQVSGTLTNSGIECKKSVIRQGVNHALIHCDLIKADSLNNRVLFIESFNEHIKLPLNDTLKTKLLSDLSEVMGFILSFDSQFNTFMQEAIVISEQANSFRTQFYDSILRVRDLITLLSDYRINPEQDLVNRETLYFDNTLG